MTELSIPSDEQTHVPSGALVHPPDASGSEGDSLYLDRCQVATPMGVVKATWEHVLQARSRVTSVVDFGAGDGRFACHGSYESYVGYEIDSTITQRADLPSNAEIRYGCAFSECIENADVCIGNPPFVRNQDLPEGWRSSAADFLKLRTGVSISGLANAWQYFFLLSLATTGASGLCALVVPYEWVSRPSVQALRDYIKVNGWTVDVYKLIDATFDSVLTTSSITLVDKANTGGVWRFFEEDSAGAFVQRSSASGGNDGVLAYTRRSSYACKDPVAKRGLSPGTQKVLTLTEGERMRHGLKTGSDVVPCVTSLKHVPRPVTKLDFEVFCNHYRDAGRKCWLLRTDRPPGKALLTYLKGVPQSSYQTSTCLNRDVWWKFRMPEVPNMLVAMSFKDDFPKYVSNAHRVRAVGGVYGIYNLGRAQLFKVLEHFAELNISNRIVAHSHGLKKLEVSQLNTLIDEGLA